MKAASTPSVTAVRPDREVLTSQRLPYFIGISGDTVGATGLSMHLVVIPPGARSEPHFHVHHETAIYVLQGRVQTFFGPDLAQSVISEAGDFLFVPPDTPHVAVNLSSTEAARAIVSRNDPAEQDKVRAYQLPDVFVTTRGEHPGVDIGPEVDRHADIPGNPRS